MSGAIHLPKKEPRKQLGLYVPASMDEEMARLARDRGITKTQVVVSLLEQALKRIEVENEAAG